MIRISLLALSVYCYGGHMFDGMRPDMLDEPVRAFHIDVNRTARESARMLDGLNGVREMRYLQTLAEQITDLTRI